MDVHIYGKLTFEVPLTEKHIAALSTLAAHHYDNACKALVYEDGFLKTAARLRKKSRMDV